jgi:O-antigen/teichoic acid export membrane protein
VEPRVPRGLLRDVLQFSASSVFGAVVSVPVSVIVARLLGPYRLGVWSHVLLAQNYLATLHLGVWAGMYRERPVQRGRQNAAGVQTVTDVTFTFALGAAALAAAGGWLYAWTTEGGREVHVAFRVLPLLLLAQYAETFLVMLLKSEQRFDVVSAVQVIRTLCSAAVVGALYVAHFDGYVWASVGSAVAVVLYLARRAGYRPRLLWDAGTLFRLLRVGFVVMLIDVASTLFETGDRVVVLSLLGVTAFGQYNLGIRLGRLASVALACVGPVVYPRMTEQYGRSGEPRDVARYVTVPLRVASRVVPVALGLLVLLLPGLVHLLLDEYRQAIAAAQVYLFGLALSVVLDTCGYMLIAVGRQASYLLVMLAAAGANALATWLAAALGGGLVGAAAGSAVVRACLGVGVVVMSLRCCGERRDAIARIVGVDVLGSALFVAGLTWMINAWIPVGDSWVEVGAWASARALLLALGGGWLIWSALKILKSQGRTTPNEAGVRA